MEIARCPDPLYTTPKPCYTADFNHYLTLHRSVLSSEQDYHLEVESVLVYVESGRGGVTINGLIFSIETGCACLLQTYHTYRFSSVKDDVLHLRVLVLDYPLLASIGYRVPDPQRIGAAMEQMPVVHCSPSTQSEMLHIFHKFEQVQEQASTHTILIKVALCGQLKLLYAQEALRAKPLPFPAPAGWNAWPYITKFCTKNLTAADVAAAVGVTVPQLNRELRWISGYSFHRLLTRARVGIAASVLLLNGLSTQYISRITGFPSENTMFRAFREWRGMTPQELREKMLSPENRCPRYMIYEKPFLILSYISNHYCEQISLSMVAKKVFLSEATVNQIISSYFGRPFHKIVTEFRMQHAKGLLRCTDLPVCDISVTLGFTSPHTFSRLFKEYFCMTPSEFRRRGRRE